MNLFERLLFRRLMNAAGEGGEGGGGAAGTTTATTAATTSQEGSTDGSQAEGDKGQQQQQQQQQQEDNKGEGEQGDKNKTPDLKAPEKYEFTAPEGTELDSKAVELFEPVARELGLSNDQAQKLAGLWPQLQEQIQNRQAESWGQQVEQWAADTKADKEIGGDKLTVSVGHAQKALDTFASKEFREFLDSTGLGNHPEMVRAFAKVGKLMSEDSFVTGQGNGSPKNDLVEAFYPSKK
ncbi:peptidase [Klebsiella pneumoniae]|uniref:peptidase n=1 Tax=Klebsiella pneumoniae TaxID=573 RepID=UPI00159D32ED|nr:peptidase [Klebsiella pneumoniae]